MTTKKATYCLRVPIAGYTLAIVEGPLGLSAEQAFDKWSEEGMDGVEEELTWEVYKHLSQGNVSYAECNDVSISSIEEWEEEFEEPEKPNAAQVSGADPKSKGG